MKKTLSIILAIIIVLAALPYAMVASATETINALTTTEISDVVGMDINDGMMIYQNDFSSGSVPINTHAAYPGIVNAVSNGKWNISGGVASLDGVTRSILNDFIASFELNLNSGWGEYYFAYHANTGWPGVFSSSLAIKYTDGSKLAIELTNGSAKNTTEQCIIPGKNYNIILKSVDNTASVYIWEKGTAAPTEPTISTTSSSAGSGDLHLYTYDANGAIDNLTVYNPDMVAISYDEISSVSGVTVDSSKLVYSSDFISGSVPINTHAAYPGIVNAVYNGKWNIEGAVGSSDGVTRCSLNDFIASFDLNLKSGWGEYYFAYHANTGWPGAFSSSLAIKCTDGSKFAIILNNGSATNTTEQCIIPGKNYNIILKSVGNTASVYIWEKGTAAPTEPTISTTSSSAGSGDLHLYTYDANGAIDNLNVFNITHQTEYSKSDIESLTGYTLNDVYENNFNAADATVPVTNKDDCDGNYSISSNKKWHLTGHTSSSALLNKSICNFVFSTEIYMGDVWSTNTIFFRSLNGARNYSISFAPNEGSSTIKASISIEGETYDIEGPIYYGVDYQLVIVGNGKTISVYMWEREAEIPTAPLLSIESYDAANGDFEFYTYNGNTYLDNIKIYEIAADALTTEEIAALTGIEITDDNLSYSNDFSTNEVPVTMHDAYLGSTNAIVNGEWNVAGDFASLSGLTGNNYTDFIYSFDLNIKHNVLELYFATITGWPGYNANKISFEWAPTGMKVGMFLGENSTSTEYLLDYGYIYYGSDYRVVITSIDDNLSLYLWAIGDEAPEEALLSLELNEYLKGDFHFYGYNTDCSIDNIKVYDLGSDDFVLNAEEPVLRSQFISGVIFGFNYDTAYNANVIEKGIIITSGSVEKTLVLTEAVEDNGIVYFEAVATGMDAGAIVEAKGYVIVVDENNNQNYIYSDTVTVNVDEIGYVEALYGDVNGDEIVDIRDLIRAKKHCANENVEINIGNTDIDGTTGVTATDLTKISEILLKGIEKLVPDDLQYIQF